MRRTLWGASKDERLAARWFPLGAMKIEHPEGLGLVYVAQFDSPKLMGQVQIVAYRGTAGKADFNFRMTLAQAEEYVSKWFESLTKHQEYIVTSRADSNKPHTFKVGDIVHNSWGYDQTNCDFYQVVRVSERNVWIRRLVSETNPSEGCSPMSGYCSPVLGSFVSDATTVQRKASGDHVCFKYGSGNKWDGKPKYESWYA